MKRNIQNLQTRNEIENLCTQDEAGEYVVKSMAERMVENANRPFIQEYKKDVPDLD